MVEELRSEVGRVTGEIGNSSDKTIPGTRERVGGAVAKDALNGVPIDQIRGNLIGNALRRLERFLPKPEAGPTDSPKK